MDSSFGKDFHYLVLVSGVAVRFRRKPCVVGRTDLKAGVCVKWWRCFFSIGAALFNQLPAPGRRPLWIANRRDLPADESHSSASGRPSQYRSGAGRLPLMSRCSKIFLGRLARTALWAVRRVHFLARASQSRRLLREVWSRNRCGSAQTWVVRLAPWPPPAC